MTIAATTHVPPLIEKERLNGFKGLFSADRPLGPVHLRQRGHTWINCAGQRLNYVG